MKHLLLALLLALPFVSFEQNIHIKVNNQKDTTVFLVKYYGKNLLYADTAQMVHGEVTFDGKKQKPGVLGLLLPGQKFFEFLYNGHDVDFSTEGPDFVANMKVKKSDENKLFLEYITHLKVNRDKATAMTAKLDSLKKDSKEYKDLKAKIDKIGEEVKAFQKDFAEKNKGYLVGKIVKMSTDVDVPDAPKDAKGNVIDSNFRYYFYRDHFFDNIDLKDDRLVNSPIFDQKISYFFGPKFLLQNPDTVAQQAEKIFDQMNPHGEMFKYTITHLMVDAEQPKIMGMDKVFVLLGDKYYCHNAPDGKPYVDWMTDEKLNDLCDKVNIQKHLTIGAQAIDITLPDSTEKVWKDFYSLKCDYVVLYFWEATCGHCKKATPVLEQLYEKKFKKRGIEVFGVSKAIGEDMKLWKDFIRTNKLTFTNVALTDSIYKAALKNSSLFIPKYTTIESLNYSQTYDIYSTPTIYVVDQKTHKIIAKRLGLSQLEDFMDRLQHQENAKKIVPKGKEF